MSEIVTAFVALGSNLGDRRANLDAAVERLRAVAGIDVTRVSSYYDTEPVGGPAGQGRYLNAVAEIRTTLSAADVMRTLLSIEAQLGRVRQERYGPRTIDLDLLLFGHDVVRIDEPDLALEVPHPRLHEREFVLAPLAEIAPLAVHPVHASTAKDLLDRLQRPARDLEGQTAVIAGSTSGIGRAIALALAGAGANVVIHGRRSQAAAEAVVSACRDLRVNAQCILADLHEETECARLVHDAWGLQPQGVDIWIQCAGVDILTGEARKWTFEHKLSELWAVDVRAAIQIARDVGARMKQRGRGSIVTMGWDQAETGMDGDSGQLFAAVKGAVMAFTRSLACELAPQVRVNGLAPGWIRTAWGEQAPPAWQERVLTETPLDRWGTPEDVAQAALWLVSPAAQFITGQILRVNGGAVRG